MLLNCIWIGLLLIIQNTICATVKLSPLCELKYHKNDGIFKGLMKAEQFSWSVTTKEANRNPIKQVFIDPKVAYNAINACVDHVNRMGGGRVEIARFIAINEKNELYSMYTTILDKTFLFSIPNSKDMVHPDSEKFYELMRLLLSVRSDLTVFSPFIGVEREKELVEEPQNDDDAEQVSYCAIS